MAEKSEVSSKSSRKWLNKSIITLQLRQRVIELNSETLSADGMSDSQLHLIRKNKQENFCSFNIFFLSLTSLTPTSHHTYYREIEKILED